MMALIDDIKKTIEDNPYITDGELMDKFGINETLVVSALTFLELSEEISEKELIEKFPEFAPVKIRWSFKTWIVDAFKSIWKLG